DCRAEALATVHPAAAERTGLKALTREYTLAETVIITRAGTARALGLAGKGHLGAGADADIVIYPDVEDPREMFYHPRYVIKGGELVVHDGRVLVDRPGRCLYVTPGYDTQIESAIRDDFERYYTLEFANYPVQIEHYLPERCVVPCRDH
ncbi:MAG TPA: amidohydrolase family protein, partial [Anaerolineae bacterium]